MQIGEQTELAMGQLVVAESDYTALFSGIMPVAETLYYYSHNLDDLLTRPRVAIVGTRKVTPYGRAVTQQFAGELARLGVVIVSGLAYGIDAIAHQAALDAGGLTMAILPSSLQKIYPAGHTGLARRMVEQGGALISEYPPGSGIAYKSQFVKRNRIVTAISDVLLITEAAINSGTMHTARFALEQGKDVFAVPGNITSPVSAGTNNLIRSGAQPAMAVEDILDGLGLAARPKAISIKGSDSNEQLILDLISKDIADGDQLLSESALPIDRFNQTLTMMELTGKVRALGANRWAVR